MTCEDGVGLRCTLKLSASIKRRTGSGSAAILTVALPCSSHLSDAVHFNILGIRAEHLASDGIALTAGGGVAVRSTILVLGAHDILLCNGGHTLANGVVAVETLLASIHSVASLIVLHSETLSANTFVADTVDITFNIVEALLSESLRDLALTTNTCKIGTTLVVVQAEGFITLGADIETVTDALHAILVTSAMVILCAAIVEATLNNALVLDAGDEMSTENSRMTIILCLTILIPSVFCTSTIDTIERISTTSAFVAAHIRSVINEITDTFFTFISAGIIMNKTFRIS